MSPEQHEFKPKEFQILGERVLRVCDSYGLEPRHQQLIDSVLSDFGGRPAEIFEKLKALAERIMDDPQKEDIAAAFVEISHDYVERHPLSPLGRFQRRSGFN